MTRVLLFTQTGDGRPKCVGRAYPLNKPQWPGYAPLPGEWMATAAACNWRTNADRWWLVECENADEGRLLIYSEKGPQWKVWENDGRGIRTPEGRILASGGKHGSS